MDAWARGNHTDRAMLHLCFACGLRVSELLELPLEGLFLRHPPSIRVCGKGRRERCLPLWKETASDMRAWLAVRGPVRTPELFVNVAGDSMTRAAFEYVLEKLVRVAAGILRIVRDPGIAEDLTVEMYLGFSAGWFGLWVIFGHANPAVIAAVVAVALGVHLFVLFYEEPTLRSKFAADYEKYCRNVDRWWPRVRGWDKPR